jgi:meiotic recombination protein SPO11
MPIYALVDCDPHGIAIMRTYKFGSQALGHETDVTLPNLIWLGIRTGDIVYWNEGVDDNSQTSDSQADQSQDSMIFSSNGLLSSTRYLSYD